MYRRLGSKKRVDPPTPAAYVTDRRAELPLVSSLGPLVLQDAIPEIKAAMGQLGGDGTLVEMAYPDASVPPSASAARRMPKPVRR